MLYGSSPGRDSHDDTPYINMTPMVDVILCLLIFFLAATRLYDWDESELKVSVPEVAQAAPLSAPPSDLDLVVTGPGTVRLNDRPVNLAQLLTELRAAVARYPDQGVVLRGEAGLSYQEIADVLSVCEQARLVHIRLAVRPRVTLPHTSRPDSNPPPSP
ncbi:Biopolymer transport protein ExbD/TolR [Isosphaera pallida ATCC 43644]|uniref:Biopolymer transport protein ExbD/TolR n=1 Tax=Isosphaera pallida (strain ATCC 43644 / DSM 9630 / IS1B) TaxID=575540 RepID=E8QWD8_ISOPI|nr:biopolymer transporter ExbD [Isosphaera pallida]ADV60825.1 Biopolymer transport protein ExbD/TolR [Isosphaera pallida ATCC 43644]